ncbi:ABC transporter permease [Diplocloster agilis]|uniref:ABC transporter permease n=1 Tax=Diplocloster agilis TaxID=2850323 RepID=A0A949K3P1_9FIRM|nr:ABC transporter permease [Diplocloster agilis]MBU9739194.1 ABC transporter permease [Diplocloster agilis]
MHREDKVKKIKKTSEFKTFLRRLRKNKPAMFGIIIFFTLVVLAILSPVISPYGYEQIDMTSKLQGPSAAHLFGTDQLGRDLLSRILYGGRYSLSLGILSIGLALLISIFLGSFSGFFGGWVDSLIMRILDVIQSIPSILIAIIMSAVLGSGFVMTIIALAIPCVSGYARVLRAQFLQISQVEYVEAATSLSCSKFKIMMKHILPNAWAPLIVSATMGVATTVLNASALSFIGLGIQSPTPEWGAMLSASRDYMRDYPYMVIIPGIFIMITVLGLNMFGDGVRDALDPKLKD